MDRDTWQQVGIFTVILIGLVALFIANVVGHEGIEKATDSELFRVSGFSLKTRLHSGTIYVYKRNFS